MIARLSAKDWLGCRVLFRVREPYWILGLFWLWKIKSDLRCGVVHSVSPSGLIEMDGNHCAEWTAPEDFILVDVLPEKNQWEDSYAD